MVFQSSHLRLRQLPQGKHAPRQLGRAEPRQKVRLILYGVRGQDELGVGVGGGGGGGRNGGRKGGGGGGGAADAGVVAGSDAVVLACFLFAISITSILMFHICTDV